MVGRDDVHRLVDALPEARLSEIEQLLRSSLGDPGSRSTRHSSSAGTLQAEHDLAERSEEILRGNGDIGGHDQQSR